MVKDAKQSIADISKNYGLTPQQLYEIIKSAGTGETGGGSTFPDSPFPGFGQKTIKEICQAYNLPLAEVLTRLKNAGFTAQAEDTVKDVGNNSDSTPMEVFETIKEIAP